jgi:transposase-like protein
VLLVRQLRAETGLRHGAVQRVATQLGYGVESVRQWVKQAEIDEGEAPGVTTAEAARVKELEQEVRELRRANDPAARPSRSGTGTVANPVPPSRPGPARRCGTGRLSSPVGPSAVQAMRHRRAWRCTSGAPVWVCLVIGARPGPLSRSTGTCRAAQSASARAPGSRALRARRSFASNRVRRARRGFVSRIVRGSRIRLQRLLERTVRAR